MCRRLFPLSLQLLIVALLNFSASIKGTETLVFSDDFAEFDLSVWKHEITMSGGGYSSFIIINIFLTSSFRDFSLLLIKLCVVCRNWEFEYYYNNTT